MRGAWRSRWEQDFSDKEDDLERLVYRDRVMHRMSKSTVCMEGAKEQLFEDLVHALWTPAPSEENKPTLGTFAACKTVKFSEGFILPSFHVEGLGELWLPLSAADTTRLCSVCEQAPFGKGLNTIVNTRVRRCWQVDASKLTFPGVPEFLSNTIQQLATKAVGALGLVGEGAQVEAHLYKLLFYEAGGHFSFHRDTEKEMGMFATLILQLPTDEGYTGGKLVVKHSNETKEFDAHMVSMLGFCYTVFFADCLHELEKIETGTRLCLAFNLVKRDCSLDPVHRQYISNRLGKVEAALQPWMEEASKSKLDIFGAKIAIPLQHKYTEENFSFAGLKGEDSVVAELLKECKDQKGDKCLAVHLCLVTKHVLDEDEGSYTEEEIEVKNCTQLDDSPPSEAFEDLRVDMEEAIVDPFHAEPDEEEYEGHTGNAGARLEQWYHRAMIIVWPKILSISVACQAGFSRTLDQVESTPHTDDPNFQNNIHQIVSFCENYTLQAWQAEEDSQVWHAREDKSKDDLVTPRVLNLCIQGIVAEDVMRVLQLLPRAIPYKSRDYRKEKDFKIGMRNIEVASSIARAVQAFGWEPFSSLIINLVKECALTQGESCAQLAKQLISMGIQPAGSIVAQTTFQVFETLIADLESHKMPEFSWHQPLAKLPGYPGIESFLRGPQEKYVYRGGGGLPAMRSFAEKHFNKYRDHSATDGYSAKGTPEGIGKTALCVIQKTRLLYDKSKEHWRQEQEQAKHLRVELENLRSVVPQTNAANLPLINSASASDDCKRQREHIEVSGDAGKRARSSAVEVIDLDLCL